MQRFINCKLLRTRLRSISSGISPSGKKKYLCEPWKRRPQLVFLPVEKRNTKKVLVDVTTRRPIAYIARSWILSHMCPKRSQCPTFVHMVGRTLPNSQSKFEFSPTPTPKKNWKGRKIKKKAFKLPLCHQLVQNRVTSSKESRYMKRGKLSLLFAYSVPSPTNFGWPDFFWKNSSK